MIQSRNISSKSPKAQHSLSVSHIQPLKTPFTFESQENSCNHSHIIYTDKQYKFEQDYFRQDYKRQEYSQTQDENIRQICQKQYKMKLQSVVKGYQLKLTKERQTYALSELKYKEQIQYLQRQIRQMFNSKSQLNKKNQNINCSVCSNGQIITHMKNMLDSIETDHKDCIKNKSEMNETILCLQSKIAVLESELEKSQNSMRKVKEELRSLRHEKDGWERDKREKDKVVRDLEREYHVKEAQLKQELGKAKDIRRKQEERLVQLLYNSKLGKENEQQQQKILMKNREYNPMKQSSLHSIAVSKAHNDMYKVGRYYQPKPLTESINYRQTQKDFPKKIFPTQNNFDTFRPTMNRFKYDY